jgi:hypothetical protein
MIDVMKKKISRWLCIARNSFLLGEQEMLDRSADAGECWRFDYSVQCSREKTMPELRVR